MISQVLHALPRELLDPYQSLTHLTSIFRDQNAPLVDYLTTKLSYLTVLLDDARSRPLSSYSTSSTAFVTFKDAKTARLALNILDSHPRRSLACHTTPAPDWTDLLWPRLGKSVYRSEFVRGWVVFFGVWIFTLIWVSHQLRDTILSLSCVDLPSVIALRFDQLDQYCGIHQTSAKLPQRASKGCLGHHVARSGHSRCASYDRHMSNTAGDRQQGRHDLHATRYP